MQFYSWLIIPLKHYIIGKWNNSRWRFN